MVRVESNMVSSVHQFLDSFDWWKCQRRRSKYTFSKDCLSFYFSGLLFLRNNSVWHIRIQTFWAEPYCVLTNILILSHSWERNSRVLLLEIDSKLSGEKKTMLFAKLKLESCESSFNVLCFSKDANSPLVYFFYRSIKRLLYKTAIKSSGQFFAKFWKPLWSAS